MRKFFVILAVLLVAAGALGAPAVGLAGPPDSATMLFGRPDLGSGCNFPCTDDASFHAVDKIQPGSVAISVGGTVNFDVEGFHQVAVFPVGTRPMDVESAGPFPFVNDPSSVVLGPPTLDTQMTFDEPGKYLVICNIAPHFEGSAMWGYISVHK